MASKEIIRKAVIPAAGLGTRLLPATKKTPKEMLPIFAFNRQNRVCVKPLLQVVYEQLFKVGIREFCFIVGRGKESIYDHFTFDSNFLNTLKTQKKDDLVNELGNFYEKLRSSSIVFINQPEAVGFGDAVMLAEPYVNESFLVQAGDTIVFSNESQHLKRLFKVHQKHHPAATFLVKEVDNPKAYGIIEGQEITRGVYNVESVIEKPEKPPTRLAITAIYLFTPAIFDALQSISKGYGKELQLTDGIQKLITSGHKVMAVQLNENEHWLDLSTPQLYWDVLSYSYSSLHGRITKNIP